MLQVNKKDHSFITPFKKIFYSACISNIAYCIIPQGLCTTVSWVKERFSFLFSFIHFQVFQWLPCCWAFFLKFLYKVTLFWVKKNSMEFWRIHLYYFYSYCLPFSFHVILGLSRALMYFSKLICWCWLINWLPWFQQNYGFVSSYSFTYDYW